MNFSLKNLMSGRVGSAVTQQFVGNKRGGASSGFTKTYTKADLWANGTSDITATASVWARIGQKTIPAQQRIHLGYGVSGGNPEEMGHLHFDIVDDTATNSVAEKGEIRIGYTNANETLTAVMFQERTEQLSDTSTSVGITRANELLLPEMAPAVKGYPDYLAQEDSKLFVDFKSDATDIIVYTGIGTGAINVWKLPVTVYQ